MMCMGFSFPDVVTFHPSRQDVPGPVDLGPSRLPAPRQFVKARPGSPSIARSLQSGTFLGALGPSAVLLATGVPDALVLAGIGRALEFIPVIAIEVGLFCARFRSRAACREPGAHHVSARLTASQRRRRMARGQRVIA